MPEDPGEEPFPSPWDTEEGKKIKEKGESIEEIGIDLCEYGAATKRPLCIGGRVAWLAELGRRSSHRGKHAQMAGWVQTGELASSRTRGLPAQLYKELATRHLRGILGQSSFGIVTAPFAEADVGAGAGGIATGEPGVRLRAPPHRRSLGRLGGMEGGSTVQVEESGAPERNRSPDGSRLAPPLGAFAGKLEHAAPFLRRQPCDLGVPQHGEEREAAAVPDHPGCGCLHPGLWFQTATETGSVAQEPCRRSQSPENAGILRWGGGARGRLPGGGVARAADEEHGRISRHLGGPRSKEQFCSLKMGGSRASNLGSGGLFRLPGWPLSDLPGPSWRPSEQRTILFFENGALPGPQAITDGEVKLSLGSWPDFRRTAETAAAAEWYIRRERALA